MEFFILFVDITPITFTFTLLYQMHQNFSFFLENSLPLSKFQQLF